MKLKVKAVAIAAPESEREKITDFLAYRGTLEITDPGDTGDLTPDDVSVRAEKNESDLDCVRPAVTVIDKLIKKKFSVASLLEPKPAMSGSQIRDELADRDGTLAVCKKINDNRAAFDELAADSARAGNEIEVLLPWQNFDVSPKVAVPDGVCLIAGVINDQTDKAGVLDALAKAEPSLERFEIEVISSLPVQTCLAVVCLRSEESVMETALRAIGFSRFTVPLDKSPADSIADLRARIKGNDDKRRELDAALTGYTSAADKMHVLLDRLLTEKEILGIKDKLHCDGRVFYIRGYAEEKNAHKLAADIEERFDAAVTVTDPADDEDVPDVLKNNGFSRPLEKITAMYSMPGRTDIDPTGVMAFFYYFFFGMMLSDAGYGLIICIGCAVLMLKYKCRPEVRDTLKMFFFCGLSTVFWGAMYGSWFGDLINVIRYDIMGLPKIRLYIWLEPVDDLLHLLVWCFIFGLVHLFTGVLLKGITSIRNGDKFGAFCDTVPTFLTVFGLIPTFFGLFTTVPAWMKSIQIYLLIPGIVLVALTGGRESKGIGGKIGLGLYSVYNMFGGYLGDVLSYARLLALGLATGVIAEVINMLCMLPSSKPLRIIMLIVVGLVGHIANLGINVIGAYVHTNRLQYVEFFGKFYEGGGRALTPLKDNHQYYSVKEEN